MIWTRDSEDALSNAKSDKKVILLVSLNATFVCSLVLTRYVCFR